MKPKTFVIVNAVFKIWVGFIGGVLGWGVGRFLWPYFVQYWMLAVAFTALFGVFLFIIARYFLSDKYYD